MGLRNKIQNVIEDCYRKPGFFVKDNYRYGCSQNKVQKAGIRQGCPLSPYLLLLVMTVMINDIHNRKGDTIRLGNIDGLTYSEVLYADDTLLALERTRETNILLHEIETDSSYYNMKLNKKINVR